MPSHELLVTSNATDLSADGWLKIAPWGDHPNSVGLQRVQKEDGDAMVAAFNSLVGKAGRMFRGVPIFVGHPDRDPNRYPDKRRYGKITALESRADGLYAKPAFNDLGERVIEQGHYLYNSPVWALKREGNVVRPIELLSIGLTNEPNIKGEPWAKNEAEEAGDTEPLIADNKDGFITIDGHVVFIGADKDTTDEKAKPEPKTAPAAAEISRLPHRLGGNLGMPVSKVAEGLGLPKDFYEFVHTGDGYGSQATGHHQVAEKYRTKRLDAAQSRLERDIKTRVPTSYSQKEIDAAMHEIATQHRSKSATNTTPNTEHPTPETPMTAEEKAQIESQLAALNTKIAELTAALAARDAETLAANASNATALQTAAADLAAANAKLATERTARIELAANSIVAAGRRTTAQRAELVAELTAANDLDAAITAASNAKPALPTTSAVADLGKRKAEGQKTAGVAINEAVRAYAAEHQCDLATHLGYNLAWNGAKTKNPALFGVK